METGCLPYEYGLESAALHMHRCRIFCDIAGMLMCPYLIFMSAQKWLDEDADVRPLLEALDYALNDMSYHTVAQHVLLPSNAVFIFRGRTGRMQAARGHALLRATKELCARLQFVVNETDGRQPLRWLLTDSGNGLLPREVRQWECQSTHSLLNIRRTYSSV